MSYVQLASWFDLDFIPRSSPNGASDDNDAELKEAWEYPIMPPPNPWPWMAAQDNGLNPAPTPEPLPGGLDVKLSTGPDGQYSALGASPCHCTSILTFGWLQLPGHTGS